MRTIKSGWVVWCLGGLMLCSGAALAEVKVGFVNTVRLMEMAPQAKAASTKMETEFAPREKELVETQREIQALEEKLARDAAVMSEEERLKLDRDIRNRKREFKRMQDEFREDLNIRRNEELARLQKTLAGAIEQLGKEKDFDLILEDTGVIFANQRIDITDLVLERLKNQGPSSGE